MRTHRDVRGGFLLGASLGLVFVPCAGPVLGAITASAASLDFGVRTVALTIAYATGIAVPMPLIAAGGQQAAERTKAFRTHAREVRAALGIIIAAGALALPSTSIREHRRRSTTTRDGSRTRSSGAPPRSEPRHGRRPKQRTCRAAEANSLDDFDPAPGFARIAEWLNTPGGRPVRMANLRGKVVLVDFWTYTCINCSEPSRTSRAGTGPTAAQASWWWVSIHRSSRSSTFPRTSAGRSTASTSPTRSPSTTTTAPGTRTRTDTGPPST